MKNLTKKVKSMAYDALERRPFELEDNKILQLAADDILDRFIKGKLTKRQIMYWAFRQEEFISLN